MSFNLIIPAAANKIEFQKKIPYIFEEDPNGEILLFKSLNGIDLALFDNIYITILKVHNSNFNLKEKIDYYIKDNKNFERVKVVVLETETVSQPETIYKTILHEKISGSIMIKDPDSIFKCSIKPGNFICTFPLDELKKVNPADKSYLSIDDNKLITNIVEKNIISRYFCVGGYLFDNTSDFIDAYNNIESENIYLSHIVFYLLLNNKVFRPNFVTEYSDFGTNDDWESYKSSYKTLFFDIEKLLNDTKLIKQINELFMNENMRIVIYSDIKFGKSLRKTTKQMKINYHFLLEGIYSSQKEFIQ